MVVVEKKKKMLVIKERWVINSWGTYAYLYSIE